MNETLTTITAERSEYKTLNWTSLTVKGESHESLNWTSWFMVLFLIWHVGCHFPWWLPQSFLTVVTEWFDGSVIFAYPTRERLVSLAIEEPVDPRVVKRLRYWQVDYRILDSPFRSGYWWIIGHHAPDYQGCDVRFEESVWSLCWNWKWQQTLRNQQCRWIVGDLDLSNPFWFSFLPVYWVVAWTLVRFQRGSIIILPKTGCRKGADPDQVITWLDEIVPALRDQKYTIASL